MSIMKIDFFLSFSSLSTSGILIWHISEFLNLSYCYLSFFLKYISLFQLSDVVSTFQTLHNFQTQFFWSCFLFQISTWLSSFIQVIYHVIVSVRPFYSTLFNNPLNLSYYHFPSFLSLHSFSYHMKLNFLPFCFPLDFFIYFSLPILPPYQSLVADLSFYSWLNFQNSALIVVAQ